MELTFAEYCGKIYAEELAKDFDREINNKEYLPQQAFSSCIARGKALSFNAEGRVDRFKALAVLFHRKGHNDKYDEEEISLMAVMPEADIKAAKGWWKP